MQFFTHGAVLTSAGLSSYIRNERGRFGDGSWRCSGASDGTGGSAGPTLRDGSRRVRVRTTDQLLGTVFRFQATRASSATSGCSGEREHTHTHTVTEVSAGAVCLQGLYQPAAPFSPLPETKQNAAVRANGDDL